MMYVAFYSDTPFGQMPVLEVNGKALAQTHAILRYMAKEVGKYNMKYPKSIPPPPSNTHTLTHTHTHTHRIISSKEVVVGIWVNLLSPSPRLKFNIPDQAVLKLGH